MSEPAAIATPEAPAAAEPAAEETIEQIAAKLFRSDAPAEKDAAPEAPAPVEAPKVDPVAEKVAARIAAAQKAEMRGAKLRAEMAAEKAELEKQKAEHAESLKVAEAVKAAKLSPSKALELLGFDAKTFLESLATEHEPEAVAARAMLGTQTELQKLQAKIDAMEAKETERQQAARQRALQTENEQASTGFLDFVATNAAKYPTLVEELTPQEIVREGFACLDEIVGKDASGKPVTRLQAFQAENGKPPTDEEIAEFLEYRAQPRAKARTEWRTRIGQKASPPSEGKPTGVLQVSQPDQGTSPRTLTSRAASEKASAPQKWSQEQADEESLRILREALKAS
jgi:hypothetical protein